MRIKFKIKIRSQNMAANKTCIARMVRALENAITAHQELADAYAENRLPMACEATRAKVADFKIRLEKAKRMDTALKFKPRKRRSDAGKERGQ